MLAVSAHTGWAAEPAPEWIDGSSMEYPREQYLVGVGMGDERATAEDRARGEIARVFSTQVTVQTSLSESERNLSQSGKTETAFSQSLSQNVQTASQKVLEGVDVVETWQDKSTAKYYALAILERAKGALALKDKISDFDKQALEWKKSLENAAGRFEKVKCAMKIMALLKARSELNKDLRVLDSQGKGAPLPFEESLIRPQAAKAIAELDVVVKMTGKDSDPIETGIVKSLNGFGFGAKRGKAEQADILIEGNVESKPLDIPDPRWKWARSSVTVNLQELKTSKTFLRLDASERQASASYEEAVRRSLASLAKRVSQQINEAISSYFENQ